MKLVKNYMTAPVITIKESQTVAETIKLMVQRDTDGLVVVNDKDDLMVVGIISMHDILKYLVPDYLEEEKNLAPFEPSEFFNQRAKKIADDKISKLMTSKKIYTVGPEDSLIKAATLLTEYKIHRLPVLDNGKLVGYLSHSDVRRAIDEIIIY
jgi:CBS domain-containing protein